MKRFAFIMLGLLLAAPALVAQEKNFIDVPYLETAASVDTLVTPDKIYLNILLAEKDTKGKISIENLEEKMVARLEAVGVDVSKQLEVADLLSNFKQYFLKPQEVMKAKSYSLLVHDAATAMRVLVGLEEEGISNVSVERAEYSGREALLLELKRQAVLKARQNAEVMTAPLRLRVREAIYISDVTGMAMRFQSDFSLNEVIVTGYAKNRSADAKTFAGIEFKKLRLEAKVNVKFRIE
jgi:uncharacterized protein YggE